MVLAQHFEADVLAGLKKVSLPGLVQLLTGSTDPGSDPDDLMAVAYAVVQSVSSMNQLAAITERENALLRAKLERGALKLFNLASVPVAVGSNYAGDSAPDFLMRHPIANSILTLGDEAFPTAAAGLRHVLRNAPPRSLTLLLIGGLRDLRLLLINEPELLRAVQRAVIMGGIEVTASGDPVFDNDGLLKPDLTAANNKFDVDAAKLVYAALQMEGIPLTVISRHTATAARYGADFWERCAATGHPVATYLRDFNSTILNRLYQRTWAEGVAREGLPEDRNPQWFAREFCLEEGLAAHIGPDEDIWHAVKVLKPYDVIATAFADERTEWGYGNPMVVYTRGVSHRIYGATEAAHGLKNPHAMMLHVTENVYDAFSSTADYANGLIASVQ